MSVFSYGFGVGILFTVALVTAIFIYAGREDGLDSDVKALVEADDLENHDYLKSSYRG